MPHQIEVKIDNDVMYVSGDLDFNTAVPLYKKSLQVFSDAGRSVVIDLSGLHSTNSAALAVMIGWLRLARQYERTVHFRNVSADIIKLAKASGLNKIIEPVIA